MTRTIKASAALADGGESPTKGGAMRALVIYESMYGNTHAIASHIGDALRSRYDVTVVPVSDATAEMVADADFVVCGGPTHAHAMTSSFSRQSAIDAADKDYSELSVDPAAKGPGLRDWFQDIGHHDTAAAAFDTRIDGPATLTGRACKGIARRLRRRGFRLVTSPESFLVDKKNHLLPGEDDRATRWGASLARQGTLVAVDGDRQP
jgi:hypothetical protein